MHEVVAHIVFVEILVGATLDAHLVDFHSRVPGLVDDTTCLDVAEFCADEGRALAGLDMEKFNNKEIVAVDIEAHAILEISCSCHKMNWLYYALIYFSLMRRRRHT